MLRRAMGAFVALMLAATLLLPLASVGAQDDEIDPGAAPVNTEQTLPESDPPPAVDEPPIPEPQPEIPVAEGEQAAVDEAVIEPPVAEEPAAQQPPASVEEPDAEEPAAEVPVTDEPVTEAETGEDTETPGAVETPDEESEEVEATGSTSISGVGLTCTGLLTFTIDTTNGGPVTIWLYAVGDEANTDLGEEVIASPSPGTTQVQLSVDSESLPDSIGASIVDDAYDLIGSTTISGCAGDDGDDEAPENGVPSVISSASLACDGTLTFTIAEAGDETLNIQFTNLHAPSLNQDMGSVSFPVTGAGVFQVSVGVDAWVDVFQADISSPLASGFIGRAAAYGCVTGEEQALGYGISNMSVTCTGAITFTVGAVEGGVSIQLFDGSTNPRTLLGSAGLGYIIDGGGEQRTIDFELPEGQFDSLVAHAWSHNDWAPLDIAYANDCVDEEEPELPEVQNLTVTCTGLVTFELVTTEAVLLDISIFIPAAAPGYRDSTQITAESGSQRVQFELPVHPFEWATGVSLGTELLADAGVQGCPMLPLNTLPGSDVTVPVAGGTVTFENVLEPGETIVTQLDPESAPPLPDQYDGQVVIMVDLSTTAVFDGLATVCLPITPEVAADAENVRLLHFENGAWVDITTSVSDGQVCGVTSHFSPFAIVKLSGQEPEGPGGPGEPAGPHEPGHHGPKPGAQHARPQHGAGNSSDGVSLTSLPNTGSGAQSGGDGTQTVQLLLCALALIAACGLRLTPRTRGTRSR